MAEQRNAVAPYMIERGELSDTLMIAFTGGLHWLNFPLFEFFETTETLRYSRILLKDKRSMFYHFGVDWRRNNWPKLLAFLQQQIDRLGPKRVICIGSSAGGYAALLAGYYLKSDYVHAFGPRTVIRFDPEGLRHAMSARRRRKMAAARRTFREALDMAPLLQQGNMKTKFFVHYCLGHEQDRWHAERVAGLPTVTTFGYPGDTHVVAAVLAKKRFLGTLLKHENQELLVELAGDHFGAAVAIVPAGSRTSPASVLGARRSNEPMR
jgi:pimeloyl-ACP methyl ester carboxylesterase